MQPIVFAIVFLIISVILFFYGILCVKKDNEKNFNVTSFILAFISFLFAIFAFIYPYINEDNSSKKNNIDTTETTSNISTTVVTPSLNISEGAIRLYLGNSHQIGYSISPPSDKKYTIVWKSSNPNIVSVDRNGTLISNSVGVVRITATLSDYPNTSQSITVFSECIAQNNGKIDITYDQILKNEVTGKYYVFFNISNYNDTVISKTRVEIYNTDGKMYDEQEGGNTSKLSNFIGYFDLEDNVQYLAIGYIILEDGTEYSSSSQIISTNQIK